MDKSKTLQVNSLREESETDINNLTRWGITTLLNIQRVYNRPKQYVVRMEKQEHLLPQPERGS